MSLEEISFRNMISFYIKELREAKEGNCKKLSYGDKRTLRRLGVLRRCFGIGRGGSVVKLTPKTSGSGLSCLSYGEINMEGLSRRVKDSRFPILKRFARARGLNLIYIKPYVLSNQSE